MAHHEPLDPAVYKSQVSAVWKATIWLTVITVVEVVAAIIYMEMYEAGEGPRLLLNGFFVVMSLLKAFFIVGEFMHMRYEKRALVLTVLVPTVFLIWFIIAFLWEGSAWLNARTFWEVIG